MAQGVITNPNPNISLPQQMIPLSKKGKEWKGECMDALEQIGTHQYFLNMSLVENYEMVKGKFIFKHYLEQDEYADMVHQLSREFEIPNYLRHYDIISQVINTLSGEYQKRPDNFRVKGFDENTTNNYVREKTRLLLEHVTTQIDQEINMRLVEQGLDPEKGNFQSEEEMQAYKEQLTQAKKALTPPEIERYMKFKWQDAAEIWGQHQLELDRQRFNLSEKERKEFEDMLIADRCFRHYYLTGNGYNQETWNPVNTFFHKSPEVDAVEDGDYVGRILYLTIADIIDRYGFLMTKKQLAKLETDKELSGKKSLGKDGYGVPYGSVVPHADYPAGKLMQDTFGFNPLNPIPTIEGDVINEITASHPQYLNMRGYFKVTEGYWKSQKKIGKACFIDPETGVMAKMLVDETFVVPEHFTQMDSSLYDDSDLIDSVTWTWVNETWGGIRIRLKNNQHDDVLDINVNPLAFQFKGDNNPYFCKLPVCGQIFNNRNSQSMSMVDLMKPWQIGFNVGANQLYQIMQREIGAFLIMDVNMLTNFKDWGGENSYEKFLLVAKSLGVTFVDTSPQNMKGANAANGMPKQVDLDESARMLSRMKIMEFFETRALSQVGITPQRLGQVTASETATGTQQAVSQSYAQTESYFTRFSEYKKRTLKMNLDIAQYVQAKNKDVTVSYIKSDMSRAFIKLNGIQLLLADLHCYVSNSQEDLRQLETLRQLFMTNNNIGATPLDLAQVITSNSPAEIKSYLEVSVEKNEQKYQEQMQLEQEKIQTDKEIAQAEMENENMNKELDRQNKKEIEYIRSFINQDDNTTDDDADGVADLLQYNELSLKANSEASKFQLEREKATNEKQMKLKELQFKQKELLAKERMNRDNNQTALKNKVAGEKSKVVSKKKK